MRGENLVTERCPSGKCATSENTVVGLGNFLEVALGSSAVSADSLDRFRGAGGGAGGRRSSGVRLGFQGVDAVLGCFERGVRETGEAQTKGRGKLGAFTPDAVGRELVAADVCSDFLHVRPEGAGGTLADDEEASPSLAAPTFIMDRLGSGVDSSCESPPGGGC